MFVSSSDATSLILMAKVAKLGIDGYLIHKLCATLMPLRNIGSLLEVRVYFHISVFFFCGSVDKFQDDDQMKIMYQSLCIKCPNLFGGVKSLMCFGINDANILVAYRRFRNEWLPQ